MDDIIVNPQRNSNCLLQASSLNGGNVAQSFNLQGMRIIKGYIKLYDIPPAYSNNSFKTIVLDYYSGNPIQLPPSGCIISMAIENISSQPIPAAFSSTSMCITRAEPPTYDPITNTWLVKNDNDTTVYPIIPYTSLTSFNTGIVYNINTVYGPAYNFLVGVFNVYYTDIMPIIPIKNPTLGVIILLVNPTLAQ
jgi:hypothetical protein